MVGCIFKENVQIWGGVAPTSMKRGYVGKNEARCDYMGGAQTRLVCRVRNVGRAVFEIREDVFQ